MDFNVFSAVETLHNKSSMVAEKVANFPSHLSRVTTVSFSLTVLISSPIGVL